MTRVFTRSVLAFSTKVWHVQEWTQTRIHVRASQWIEWAFSSKLSSKQGRRAMKEPASLSTSGVVDMTGAPVLQLLCCIYTTSMKPLWIGSLAFPWALRHEPPQFLLLIGAAWLPVASDTSWSDQMLSHKCTLRSHPHMPTEPRWDSTTRPSPSFTSISSLFLLLENRLFRPTTLCLRRARPSTFTSQLILQQSILLRFSTQRFHDVPFHSVIDLANAKVSQWLAHLSWSSTGSPLETCLVQHHLHISYYCSFQILCIWSASLSGILKNLMFNDKSFQARNYE